MRDVQEAFQEGDKIFCLDVEHGAGFQGYSLYPIEWECYFPYQHVMYPEITIDHFERGIVAFRSDSRMTVFFTPEQIEHASIAELISYHNGAAANANWSEGPDDRFEVDPHPFLRPWQLAQEVVAEIISDPAYRE